MRRFDDQLAVLQRLAPAPLDVADRLQVRRCLCVRAIVTVVAGQHPHAHGPARLLLIALADCLTTTHAMMLPPTPVLGRAARGRFETAAQAIVPPCLGTVLVRRRPATRPVPAEESRHTLGHGMRAPGWQCHGIAWPALQQGARADRRFETRISRQPGVND